MTCVLCKIVGEQRRAVYDDGACVAFADDKPQGRAHYVIAPKQHLDDDPVAAGDAWMERLLRATTRVLKKLELKRYRLVINHNVGRTRHLHVHVISVP